MGVAVLVIRRNVKLFPKNSQATVTGLYTGLYTDRFIFDT